MLRPLLLLVLLAAASCSKEESGSTRPFTTVLPTVIVEDTELDPGLARIVWQVLNDDGRVFRIERRFESNPWKSLLRLTASDGTLVVEDPSVQVGQTYSYRVGVGREYQGEVTVTIPSR